MTMTHSEFLEHRTKQIEEEIALFREAFGNKYPELLPLIDAFVAAKDDKVFGENWETDRDRTNSVLTDFMYFLLEQQS